MASLPNGCLLLSITWADKLHRRRRILHTALQSSPLVKLLVWKAQLCLVFNASLWLASNPKMHGTYYILAKPVIKVAEKGLSKIGSFTQASLQA